MARVAVRMARTHPFDGPRRLARCKKFAETLATVTPDSSTPAAATRIASPRARIAHAGRAQVGTGNNHDGDAGQSIKLGNPGCFGKSRSALRYACHSTGTTAPVSIARNVTQSHAPSRLSRSERSVATCAASVGAPTHCLLTSSHAHDRIASAGGMGG